MAADRVQMLTRGREIAEQEDFLNHNPDSRWTLQQFSTNPSGEPWMALQEYNENGLNRTITGTREELDGVIEKHGLTPQELPAITEGEYYRQTLGSIGLAPEITREESVGLSV